MATGFRRVMPQIHPTVPQKRPTPATSRTYDNDHMTSSVRAVHDDDLRAVLEALGLAGPFERGELHCKFCGAVVTWETLQSLLADSGSIKVICDKPECSKALLLYINERQKDK